MEITELITPERVACGEAAGSKKKALEIISALIARADSRLVETEIFDALVARERLGSTGLGHGVALPHGRLASLDRTLGAFVRLDTGVDFDAADRQPVDLLFAMVVPEASTEEHLQILAKLARMFGDPVFRQRLREAPGTAEAYQLLTRGAAERVLPAAAPHG
ncbi:MAG TPA: PTS IIA-like nitrogen-regulatory protein PtsN [Gammaproteobacteria bacterium]|nr:PTS IIA-like nitrogen-regulatory protein PtsN [Gammaproteobacteria bacterium]